MDRIRTARVNWAAKLAMLESHLAQNTYIAGDSITMGDMPPAILCYRWFNLEIEREDMPNLRRWYDLVAARPAFIKHVIDIGLA